MPDEGSYTDSPEVDFLRFIVGIVDAIEVAGSWESFIIPCVPGKAPAKGAQYRNTIVAMVCMLLWEVPDTSWRNIAEIKKNLDMSKIPRKALRAQSEKYMERLEGLRAEARELLSHSGDQFLDEVCRGGGVPRGSPRQQSSSGPRSLDAYLPGSELR